MPRQVVQKCNIRFDRYISCAPLGRVTSEKQVFCMRIPNKWKTCNTNVCSTLALAGNFVMRFLFEIAASIAISDKRKWRTMFFANASIDFLGIFRQKAEAGERRNLHDENHLRPPEQNREADPGRRVEARLHHPDQQFRGQGEDGAHGEGYQESSA